MEDFVSGIHLDRVEINSAGPIGSFRAELAPLTVFYARNERGKTTIVENLVACLFQHAADEQDALGLVVDLFDNE